MRPRPTFPLMCRLTLVSLLVSTLGQSSPLNADQPPLHSLIDQKLVPVAGTEAPLCSDTEFMRRVSLDLIGMPPTADQTRGFLNDSAQNKRTLLIDRLIESPHYTRHIASMLDLMLMERRANTHVTADQWQAWLIRSVRENKPWNVLARELLLADGEDPAARPAARFTLDRTSEPHLLTRDIGRIFFGRDLQCAQCHDHPLVADYLQADYHGLLAFVSAGYPQVLKEADKEKTVLAEKAGQELSFESVFEGVPHRTGARMPDGTAIDEPFLLPGEEYDVAPAENTKSVPKFSRRAKLAELATEGSNTAFNENIVNRLWAQMFGRGLVHPLDLHHAGNPANDPELMTLLTNSFVESNYDFKAFLRELALTEAYQRSFDAPNDPLALAGRALEEVRAIDGRLPSLEQQAEKSADAYSAATAAWYAAEAVAIPVATEVDEARKHYAEAKKKLDEATAGLATANANLKAKQLIATSLQQAVTSVQGAAKLIPKDAEIADAVNKLLPKSEQATAEVAALTKTVADLTAALPAPTETLKNAMPPLDTALAKLAPLSAAVKETEQQMLIARRQSAEDAGAVTALRQRLETAMMMAQLPKLQQAIETLRQVVTSRESELGAAQQSLTQHVATMAQVDNNLNASIVDSDLAKNALLTARAEHAKRVAEAKSITLVLDAANVASGLIPGDPVLTEVATKLQQRTLVAQTRTGPSQQQVDTAAAAEKVSAETLASSRETLAAATAQRDRQQQAIETASAGLAMAKTNVTQKQAEFDLSVTSLTDRWFNDFTVSALKPLTPEQLCWSVFRVTGVYQRYWDVELAELDKTKPLTDEQKQDAAIVAAREVELEQRVYDKLKGNIASFVSFYGAAAGQPQRDFFSTADQALFAANGGPINSWVVPSGDNVTNRMIGQADPKVAAEELYLGILTRLPTEVESNEVENHLAGRDADKPIAAGELVWALLNSAEFRFNH